MAGKVWQNSSNPTLAAVQEKFFGDSQRKRRMCKIGIIISSIDAQVQAALYVPIIALIVDAFPGQAAQVNFAFSVTSGVMVAFIFISGILAKYFDKRNLLVVGTIFFMMGGFLGSFSQTATWLIFTRAIEGIGGGLVYPMVPAISAQLFDGEERAHLLGITNGGACAIAFCLNFLAGAVGKFFGWRWCLYLYIILLVSLFFQFKYIPKLGPEKDILNMRDASTGARFKVPKGVWIIAAGYFCIEVFFSGYQMLLPTHILQSGIGDSLLMGSSNSLNVFVGILIGLIFGKMVTTLKKLTPALACVFFALAYWTWGSAHGPFAVYLGMLFSGIAMGTFMPYFYESVARVCDEVTVTIGMTYVNMGGLLGFFFISFWVNLLNRIFGDFVKEFYFIAAYISIVAIIFIILGIRANRRDKNLAAAAPEAAAVAEAAAPVIEDGAAEVAEMADAIAGALEEVDAEPADK